MPLLTRFYSLVRAFTVRGLFAAMVLLALVAAVHGIAPRQAQPSIEFHVVAAPTNITANVGDKKNVSLSLDVRGAPVEHSECTVQGTGTRGPWSGPTYTWDAPVSSDASAVGATLDNTSETTNTLHLNILKAGNYTVSVTGHVSYSSSCGPATGQDTAIINVHVNGKVWDVGEAISGGEVSTVSGETSDHGAITVLSGATVDLKVSEATDSDHWKNGTAEDTDADTLKYTWAGSDIANSGTLSQTEGMASTWTAPTLPAIIASETREVTVTINDTPKAIAAGEGGTRDDADDTVKRKIVFNIVHQGNSKNWSSTPALDPGTIVPSSQVVHPGQRITINLVSASDSDTWTMSDGTQGTQADLKLKYNWNPGPGTIVDGDGTSSIVWQAPTQAAPDGTPIAIGCEVDDSLAANETGVTAPETGTRNDDPVTAPGVTLQLTSSTCGYYKHTSWDVAPSIDWTEDSQGYPDPIVPQATEHANFDDCTGANSTANPPKTITFDYKLVSDEETKDADGTAYREVTYQAMSRYGGPDSPLLKDKRPLTRTWSATPGISGGELATPSAGAVVQAGQTLSLAVGVAHDSDTWTRGSYSTTVDDKVGYLWSSNVGSFASTTSPLTLWTAPAAADVPAGSDGLSVTLTCTVDDKWQGEETGVQLPDKGTRNDTGLSRSVTVKVVREPCGQWKHKAWSESQPLAWRTDGNGDPEPIAPAALTETVSWQDDCGGTTKPDQTRTVAYTQTQDESVKDANGVWQRAVKYQAFSTCPGGADAPVVTGQKPLPRHWTTPGELDGGNIKVTVTGVTGAPDIAATTPGQAITVTLPAGAGAGASFVVSDAKDTDTYTYRGVPEQVSDDGITYHWKLNGGSATAPLAEVDLGTGSSAALPAEPALPPGSYTVSCEVDDSSAGQSSGVTAPDLGNRNDAPKNYSVSVKIVGKTWEAGQGIGYHPKEDADGKQLDPVEWVEDGQIKLPKLADKTKAVPGEAVELEVNPASDWDAWTREGIDKGIATDGPLTYKWSTTGGKFRVTDGQGNVSEATQVDGLKATWIAPAPDASAGNADSQSYTLTCTIDDGTLPRIGDNESGTHDDEALKRTVSVEVVPSYWSPEDKGIGFYPTLDEVTKQPVEPFEWHEDGRMTAPIDQTVATPDTEKKVAPGASVPCAVELAQDWDTLTTKDGKSIAQDDTLTYTWTADKGKFRVTHDDGITTDEDQATGTSATWIAPEDVTEDTDAQVKCTIDDASGDRVTAPISGSHDDSKLERTAKIKVMIPKVTFTQTDGKALPSSGARSCAGGIGLDGVHDFTILATAKLSDGTIMPEHTPFKLSFENNKGHDYSGDDAAIWPAEWIAAKQKSQDATNPVPMDIDKLIKKAKFVTTDQNGNPKLVETLPVETDKQGQFTVHVLSSDIVSSDIKIKVKRTTAQGQEVDAGEQVCDFGEAVSYRRFDNWIDPDEVEDDGWLFGLKWLNSEKNTTTAKVYLKFMIDSDKGDVNGNWKEINGHQVLINISDVESNSDTQSPNNDYAKILNAQSDGVLVTTVGDGAATVQVQAGPKIDDVVTIWFDANDQSQWDQ